MRANIRWGPTGGNHRGIQKGPDRGRLLRVYPPCPAQPGGPRVRKVERDGILAVEGLEDLPSRTFEVPLLPKVIAATGCHELWVHGISSRIDTPPQRLEHHQPPGCVLRVPLVYDAGREKLGEQPSAAGVGPPVGTAVCVDPARKRADPTKPGTTFSAPAAP